MKNARLSAFEILYDILKNNAYSNLVLEHRLSSSDASEKPFVTNLVYGVIERKLTLDFLLNQYVSSKPKPKVKVLLYIGVYQLYFMEKVPSRAAINETVALADEVGCSYYKNFINAVLHKIDEHRLNIDEFDDLSLRYSCPPHLINMWKKMYGDEQTAKILSSLNQKPPIFAIPNVRFVDAEELQYELLLEEIESEIVNTPYGDVLKILSTFDLSNCSAFSSGLFHIEDLSSFECASVLEVKQNDSVIDICSAPGGKAFTIAEHMKNTGNVIACDLYEHRVNLIQKGAERLCLDNIDAVVNDALIFNDRFFQADKVLCDVPCSGFGIIRRKPEIRYKDLDSIKELPELQYRILTTSCAYVKNGGRLIYSTCTLNKRENEKVVERFLSEHSEFKLLKMKTIFPDENGGDGFFYAVTEKNNDRN